MNEEEIIKYTKNIINATYIKATNRNENGNITEQWLVNKNVIQGLLDLYNKEKEKNKKLNKYITDKVKTGKEIQTFINKGYVEQEYISKDKIREIIEELENEDLVIHDDIDSEDVIIAKYEQIAVLDFCKELLEERN